MLISLFGRSIKLNSGYDIPVVGLGTWRAALEEAKMIVSEAIKKGYRHIDTAMVYENEEAIGEALSNITDKSVTRSELFVTSKLWGTDHAPEKVRAACLKSLKVTMSML